MARPRQVRLPDGQGTDGAPVQNSLVNSLAVLQRLIAELGTPHLLRLMAETATERANALARQGASAPAARASREAALLRRAANEILD